MAILINTLLLLLLIDYSLGNPLSREVVAEPERDSSEYRLPGKVEPVYYNIKFIPNITAETFEGQIEIIIKVKANTKEIVLHSRNLEISKDDIEIDEVSEEAKQNYKNIIPVENAKAIGEPDQEFFAITLKTELKVCSKYIVKILKYTGVLNKNSKGFYIAQYKDENGSDRKFVRTQFAPTFARSAFPCFDEPALKAKFKIAIVRPKDYSSVSNTPKINTKAVPNSDEVEDEFSQTEEMSTYLIAFIVSEMKLSDVLTVNNVNHQILARPQVIKDGTEKYALNAGSKILKEIESFVDVSYSLKKMDQVAIPDNYYSASGMENWGLVTYGETHLLYSNKATTSSMKQSIITTIAHQFGHQWFGNLVSPKWWKYLWLSKGFATYFQYRGADLVYPDWGIMDQYVVRVTQFIFGPDSLENSTRPMNYDAGSSTGISELFDRVAYEKSGSVIRMMEACLTTEVFKKGLHYYLEDRKYNDAEPENLYENLQKALDESSDINLPKELTISKIMNIWAEKEGYPVVYVRRNYFTDSADSTVMLSQNRFLLKSVSAPYDSSWMIPINFATKTNKDFDNTTADNWLTVKEMTIDVTDLKKDEWLLINKKQTGYYRVSYDVQNWRMLIEALINNHTEINVLNRAQLIDDSFNLARSGRLSYEIPLGLSLYLKNETHYIPFYSFFNAIDFLNTMLSGSPSYSTFKEHVIDILGGIYEQLGDEEKEDDSHMDKLNRANILKWLCDLGHTECRTKALTKLQNWQNDENSPVAVDFQAAIFCGAIRIANETEWEYLYSQYEDVLDGFDTELRSRILNALGCSDNVDILKSFLKASVDETNKVNAENAFSVVYNSGYIGVEVVFDYVLKDFKDLHSKLGNRLTDIISGIGSKLTTKVQLTKLQELAQENKNQPHLFRTGIANAEENVNWNNNRLVEVTNWLEKASKGNMSHEICSSIFVLISSYLFLHYCN